MRLQHVLRPDLVLTGLPATNAAQALHQISDHLQSTGAVLDGQAVEARLLEREKSNPTVLGMGVAVPHATIEGLPNPLLMVAIAQEPIPFGGEDLGLVRIFFVLLSPPGHEGDHIKLLARICRLARHAGLVEELYGSPDPAAALAALERVDAEHA